MQYLSGLSKARATTKGNTVSAGARASASRCHYFRLMHEPRSARALTSQFQRCPGATPRVTLRYEEPSGLSAARREKRETVSRAPATPESLRVEQLGTPADAAPLGSRGASDALVHDCRVCSRSSHFRAGALRGSDRLCVISSRQRRGVSIWLCPYHQRQNGHWVEPWLCCRLPIGPLGSEALGRFLPCAAAPFPFARGGNRWPWQSGLLSLPGRKTTIRARSIRVSADGHVAGQAR